MAAKNNMCLTIFSEYKAYSSLLYKITFLMNHHVTEASDTESFLKLILGD